MRDAAAAGGELGPPPAGAAGLQLVWPVPEEVQNSIEGWFGGGSILGKSTNVNKDFLKPYYHRRVAGRVLGCFGSSIQLFPQTFGFLLQVGRQRLWAAEGAAAHEDLSALQR